MILRDVFLARCRYQSRSLWFATSYRPTNQHGSRCFNHHVVHSGRPLRLAIIGSGPAGFYAASRVLLRMKDAVIDMYERLPVPYGLVRFGVAPDHPEVKNCQDKFTEVANSPNFSFIGNVEVGRDVALPTLSSQYDAVLFAYGASKDRHLGIPGEKSLVGIHSARGFVGWYNGLPEYADLSPKLDAGEEAVIIGQGNVALDVARILLSGVDRLRKTDITDHALATLAKCRIKRVHVVGRRGPMQASFTIKEVREIMALAHVSFSPIPDSLLPSDPAELPRVQKRLTKLLMKASLEASEGTSKSWSLDFLLSPTTFRGSTGVSGHLSYIDYTRMTFLEGANYNDPKARVRPTTKHVTMPASLAFRSIGYKSESIPGMRNLGIPFDEESGTIPNDTGGRIKALWQSGSEPSVKHVPGMYCTGWVKNGPNGVIASTMEDAFASAEAIVEDWERTVDMVAGHSAKSIKPGWQALKGEVHANGLQTVSWEDWQRIDTAERERGRIVGKEREKFTSIQDMLAVLR